MRLSYIYEKIEENILENKKKSQKSKKDVPVRLEVKKDHTYIYSVDFGKAILFCVNKRKKNDAEYNYFVKLLMNRFNAKSVSNIDSGDEYNIKKNLSQYVCKIIIL